MTRVFAFFSMSLDGFIAGPNVSVTNGLGDGGERLHDWMFAERTGEESEASEIEQFATTGAVLMGRTMLDVGVDAWGENPAFHAPVYVVTHRPAATIVKAGGTSYTFVTDGPAAALGLARQAAADRNICVIGGAAIFREVLGAGVVDELRVHIVPIVLGDGTPLFNGRGAAGIRMELLEAHADRHDVAHLRYRLGAAPPVDG